MCIPSVHVLHALLNSLKNCGYQLVLPFQGPSVPVLLAAAFEFSVTVPNAAGLSQAATQQDLVYVVETMKAWMPMLQAQILQQNYQGSVSSSGNSRKRKQERQSTFKRELYNYYTDKAARTLPTTIQCMITRLHLPAADVVAAHLWPKGRDMVFGSSLCLSHLFVEGSIL